MSRNSAQSASAAPPRRAPLATLEAALAAIEALAAPAPILVLPVHFAMGRVVAADIHAPVATPATPCALIDGWAVASADLRGASPQSPVPMAATPVFVSVGAPLPPRCNAMLAPAEIVVIGSFAEALAEAAPGQGVARAGYDATPGGVLAAAGSRLTPAAVAALAAAGLADVALRVPRIAVIAARPPEGGDLSAALVAAMLRTCGATADVSSSPEPNSLSEAISACAADALVLIGGTGEGPGDATLRALAEAGEIDIAGIGCWPLLTAAIGRAGGRPVLCLPGRPDAALAGALLLALPMARRLAGFEAMPAATPMRLARKIASPPGLAELRFVEVGVDGATPLPRCPMPLGLLSRAHGYVLVSAASEGIASGAPAPIYPLP